MKEPLRIIALLVILSLMGIFAYQSYWLVGLYNSMHSDMERSINEAIRISNYNEMALRMQNYAQSQNAHGAISINAAMGTSGFMQMQNTTIINDSVVNEQSRQGFQKDSLNGAIVLRPDKSNPQTQNFLNSLTNMLQSNLQSSIDAIATPDIEIFAQLFSKELEGLGFHIPFRVELLQINNFDIAKPDTLGIYTTPDYELDINANVFRYDIDSFSYRYYQITTEPLTPLILSEMVGILATSVIIILILLFSFYYLIRTILKQKTLDEMKSDFTNNITHELKTPIAVAYAANDALLNFGKSEDKEQQDAYLRICQEQLSRLSGLVEQILSMSMERRKGFRLQPEELSLREILTRLIEQHRLKTDRPINVTLKFQPDKISIVADRTHFTNILSNLIDNAIKYSPDKVDIHISCIQTDNGKTRISIKDNGIGIAKERQKYIFDKFYRVPTGNKHDVKGYGLGLFYVKTMVEKHGGSIEVASDIGNGSEFTITL